MQLGTALINDCRDIALLNSAALICPSLLLNSRREARLRVSHPVPDLSFIFHECAGKSVQAFFLCLTEVRSFL